MMSRRGVASWGRTSRISGTETGASRGPTRRDVFALPAVGLAAGAAHAQATGPAVLVAGGYVVTFEGRSWTLEAAALGLSQLPAPSQSETHVQFDITGATWPATGKTFDLKILVQPDGSGPKGDQYSVTVSSTALGWQATQRFGVFLGGAGLGAESNGVAETAAAALGWTVRAGARSLWLLPDLSWRLQAAGGFDHALRVVRADAVRLRGYAPGRSPLATWTSAVAPATSAVIAEGCRVRPRGRLRCGETKAGDSFDLRADQLAEAISSTTAKTGEIAHALSGEWRLDIRRSGAGGVTTFKAVNGLVLTEGLTITAMMPVASAQKVQLAGATAHLDGKTDAHRVVVRSHGGRVVECSVQALLVRLGVRLAGVDYSQFEFDEQEVLLMLDDARRGGDFVGATFTLAHWARWRLPLAHARLRLARARDNFSLTYSFHEMELIQRVQGWRLEPARGATNPVFVANLPPQHVLEEAFFRQIVPPSVQPLKKRAPLDANRVLDANGQPVETQKRQETQDPDIKTTNDEPLQVVAEARLSGASRLALKLPAKWPRGVRPTTPQAPTDWKAIPFTLEALTRWTAYELATPPRAQTVRAARVEADEDAPWPVETDPAKILGGYGIKAANTVDDRIKQVVSDIRAPEVWETVFEAPARVALAPDTFAKFTSSMPPRDLKAATPLWALSFRPDLSPDGAYGLHAVYSPDFDKRAFETGTTFEVSRKNEAPWDDSGRSIRFALNKNDRHQLVALSAGTGLPTLPRLPQAQTSATGRDAKDLSNVVVESLNIRDDKLLEQGQYLPPPLKVSELSLTALGASLDLRGDFEPPAAPYRNFETPPASKILPVFPALNVETWEQISTLGRDVHVKVIYKGFLFPWGHRASLVKLSERHFLPDKETGAPVAYLVQRYFIKVRDEPKGYPKVGHPFDGLDWPVTAVQFKTLKSPDILDPETGAGNTDGVSDNGKLLNLGGGAGLVFWPRVNPKVGGEVQFEVRPDGRGATASAPVLFVDNTAAHDPRSVETVVRYYRDVAPDTGLTTLTFGGAPRRYAAETRAGAATFETARWILGARGRGDRPGAEYRMDAVMEGEDQPPWYPHAREAHVQLKTLQQFSNRTGDYAVVSFDDNYLKRGLRPDANPAGIYLNIHGYLPRDKARWYAGSTLEPVRLSLDGSADRSGGVGKPNIWAVSLSAEKGPVGGQAAPSRTLLTTTALDDAVANFTKSLTAPGLTARDKALEVAAYRRIAALQTTSRSSGQSARDGLLNGIDFFPFNATVLGLLNLRELVMTAAFGDRAPELIARANAAADRVLEQLDALLADLEPKLDAAAAAGGQVLAYLKTQLETITAFGKTLAELYPRLYESVSAAAKADKTLRDEIRGDKNELAKLQAIVVAAEAFNRRVTDLLSELDRLAKDPMPAELKAVLDQVGALLTALKGLGGGLFADAFKVAGLALRAELKADLKTWVAAVLGPEAWAAVATVNNADDLKQVLRKVATTAGEAYLHETVGRPILEVATAAEKLFETTRDGLAQDVRVVVGASLDLVSRAIDGAVAALRDPLLVGLSPADGVCGQAIVALHDLTANGTGLAKSRNDLLALVATLEDCLAALALLEGQQSVALRTGARLDAAGRAAAANAIRTARRGGAADAALPAALARGQATSYRDAIVRFRTAVAGGLDRLKDAVAAFDRERDELRGLTADKDSVCIDLPQIEKILGSATRWMSLRSRAVTDAAALFTRGLDALSGVEVPVGDSLSTEGAKALLAACGLVRGLTSLRDSAQRKALQSLANGYADLLKTCGDLEGAAEVRARAQVLIETADQIAAQLTRLETDLQRLRTGGAGPVLRAVLAEHLGLLSQLDAFCERQERALITQVTGALAALDPSKILDPVVRAAVKVLLAPMVVLDAAHSAARQGLLNIKTVLDGNPTAAKILRLMLRDSVLDALTLRLPAALEADRTVLIGIRDQLRPLDRPNGGYQVAELRTLQAALAALQVWRDRIQTAIADPSGEDFATHAALVVLAQKAGGVIDTVLHGRLQDVLDVQAIRARIQSQLLDLVLPRVTLSYAFETDVNNLEPFFKMSPDRTAAGGDPNARGLSLNFNMSLNLKDPRDREMSSVGVLQPFEVNIFQCVTLKFGPATFKSVNGSSPDLDLKISDVELGPAVEFIQKLQEYLGPSDGSGFFIDFRFSPPGVEAGFAFDLGVISIGTVSFINVSLGASAELPFDNRPALFRFNLARRDSQFLISAAPFGGGGFLVLISDARSLVGFEAGFCFGCAGAFRAGPLTGKGYILTGIYVSRIGETAAISGFFLAAGSAHIACFGISACLLVTITQQGNGAMKGSATFTFTFSLGLTDVSYSVSCQREIQKGFNNGGGGSPGFVRTSRAGVQAAAVKALQAVAPPERRRAIAQLARPRTGRAAPTVTVKAETVAMDRDWRGWREYFSEEL